MGAVCIVVTMANGWESKSVEEQMAERSSATTPDINVPTPAAIRAHGDKLRVQQSLELQKEQILNQRTSNEHRRASLAAALAHVEQQLEVIGKEL